MAAMDQLPFLAVDEDGLEQGTISEVEPGPELGASSGSTKRRFAWPAAATLASLALASTLLVVVRNGQHGGTVATPPAPRASSGLSNVVSFVAADVAAGPVRKAPWQCSADGDDCRDTQCCSNSGSQCYVKNKYWASCNATCDSERPGADGKTWSCDKLGERAPPACSWEGENCTASKCCRREGFKCFAHDATWASCSDDCAKLQKFKVGGKPWSCKVLGGSQGVHFVEPVKRHPAATSLFCFTVVTPLGVVAPGVKAGYEQELLTMMKAQNLSIFGCDASRVYQGARVQRGGWQSVVNTDIFISVWQKVQADGVYKAHSWTAKVDADAVFLPDRLRAHLVSLSPPAETPLYLHNIKFRFHFMGALEVLSTKAVDTFLANAAECAKHLGNNGGEDFFTMQCLDAMNVGHMTDFSLLDDKYTHGKGWNLFDVNPCANPAIVAFHPYKAVNSWLGCYKVAMGVQKPTDFVGCNYRWHGDACSLNSPHQHNPGDMKPSDGIVFRK